MQKQKIVITGAAGLVGQNLILLLKELGNYDIIAMDKHSTNLPVLAQLNPDISIINADLAEPGDWQAALTNIDALIILHAQITSKSSEEFVRNNLTATENLIAAAKKAQVPYVVHISSSVVNSVANDDYTQTKTAQENLVKASGLNYCILRPTLMFGWFDRKHLGWLARFMKNTPVFPIPGKGEFLRQPLYAKDFCRIIIAALQSRPDNQVYDIVGNEDISYIDIIRSIKRTKKLSTKIIRIPYGLFYVMLKAAGMVMSKPPFTVDQLKALTAGDYFKGINAETTFGVTLTPFHKAIDETFNDSRYSHIVLD